MSPLYAERAVATLAQPAGFESVGAVAQRFWGRAQVVRADEVDRPTCVRHGLPIVDLGEEE